MKESSRPSRLLAIIAIPFLLRAIVAVSPVPRSWGIDFLQYFDPAEIVIWTLIAGIPSALVFRKKSDLPGFAVVVPFLLFIVIAVVLFLSPTATYFYGDGSILIPQVYRLIESGNFNRDIVLNLKSAPLTGVILKTLIVTVPDVFRGTSNITYPFIGLSALSLLLLVVFYYLYMRNESDSGLALLLAILGTGGAVFFFGYVEFYALPFVIVLGYLLASERAVDPAKPLFPAVLLFIIACLAHYSSLALLPSLIFLIILRQKKEWANGTTLKFLSVTGIILVVGIAGAVAAATALPNSRIFMPLSPVVSPAGTQAYTLFSSYHLIDFVNIILLLAPVPVIAIALFPGRRTLFGSGVLRFHFLAALFYAVFLFFANTSLGLARDWDIAAPLGIMVCLFAWRALQQSNRISQSQLTAFGAAAFLFVLPWVGLHLDSGKSAERFEDVMRLDDEHMYGDYALSGYEALRKYYLHDGNTSKEIEITKRMIELLDYPEQYRLLTNASLFLAESKPDTYMELQQWMLVRLRHRAEDVKRSGKQADYSGSMEDIDRLAGVIAYNAAIRGEERPLLEPLEAICNATGSRTPLDVVEALHEYANGRYSEARPKLARALHSGVTSDKLYGMAASAALLTGDRAAAEGYYSQGITEFPGGYETPLMLGIAFLQTGDAAKARELLETAKANNPPPDVAQQIDGMLGK